MRAHGFAVEVRDTADLASVRAAHPGSPSGSRRAARRSWAGYMVEGHAPAEVVGRRLRERPAVAGLTAPGLPTGPPGMEVPGAPTDRYDVVAFGSDGSAHAYTSPGPR